MSIKAAVTGIILMLVPFVILASTQTVKGMATVTISSSHGPSPSEKAQALQKARINAVERYVADTNDAEQRNYDLVRDKIATNIDDYVLSSTIISENADKDAKTYTVVIASDLNVSRLDNELRANSAVSNTSQSNRSYITFVFVAREQSSIQSFGNQVVKNSKSNVSENGIDTEATAVGKKEYASETNKSGATVTGSSVTQQADKVSYAVTSSDEVNDVISNQLSMAGYQVVDAAFLQQQTNNKLSINAFKTDFSHGDDISPETLSNAALGAQQAQVPYLAYGTLDVGLKNTDQTTGLTRIYVTVTAKVYDLTRRFPVTVASIGPIQYAGLGPSEDVARTNALKLAAQEAAKSLVSEMDAKGIH